MVEIDILEAYICNNAHKINGTWILYWILVQYVLSNFVMFRMAYKNSLYIETVPLRCAGMQGLHICQTDQNMPYADYSWI